MILRYVLLVIGAYLLGSFSTGLTVARETRNPDLRTVGSKNTGATNALRTMGLRNGLITFLGDYAKAALACAVGWWVTGDVYGAMVAGLAAVIGHNWPVFYNFHGGKGVASSTAVMMVCFPIPALIAYALAIAAIALTKYVSLGSLLAVTSFAVIVIVQHPGDWIIAVWAVVLAGMCFIRHRSNIGRLIRGTESKLGQKAEK